VACDAFDALTRGTQSLQAIGIKAFQLLGFTFAPSAHGGALFMSGSTAVAVCLLVAIVMAGTAAVCPHHAPSMLGIQFWRCVAVVAHVVFAWRSPRRFPRTYL
jgi:hypothetical protein